MLHPEFFTFHTAAGSPSASHAHGESHPPPAPPSARLASILLPSKSKSALYAEFAVLYSRAEGGGSTRAQRHWRDGFLQLAPGQSILWMKEDENNNNDEEEEGGGGGRRYARGLRPPSHLVVCRDRGCLGLQPSKWWSEFWEMEQRKQRKQQNYPHPNHKNSKTRGKKWEEEKVETQQGAVTPPWGGATAGFSPCCSSLTIAEDKILSWRSGWSTTLPGMPRYRIQILGVRHLPDKEDGEKNNNKEEMETERKEVNYRKHVDDGDKEVEQKDPPPFFQHRSVSALSQQQHPPPPLHLFHHPFPPPSPTPLQYPSSFSHLPPPAQEGGGSGDIGMRSREARKGKEEKWPKSRNEGDQHRCKTTSFPLERGGEPIPWRRWEPWDAPPLLVMKQKKMKTEENEKPKEENGEETKWNWGPPVNCEDESAQNDDEHLGERVENPAPHGTATPLLRPFPSSSSSFLVSRSFSSHSSSAISRTRTSLMRTTRSTTTTSILGEDEDGGGGDSCAAAAAMVPEGEDKKEEDGNRRSPGEGGGGGGVPEGNKTTEEKEKKTVMTVACGGKRIVQKRRRTRSMLLAEIT